MPVDASPHYHRYLESRHRIRNWLTWSLLVARWGFIIPFPRLSLLPKSGVTNQCEFDFCLSSLLADIKKLYLDFFPENWGKKSEIKGTDWVGNFYLTVPYKVESSTLVVREWTSSTTNRWECCVRLWEPLRRSAILSTTDHWEATFWLFVNLFF